MKTKKVNLPLLKQDKNTGMKKTFPNNLNISFVNLF